MEIDSRHGDVRVADVGGGLKLSARHGDVEVHAVTGEASLDVEYGDVAVTQVADLVAHARNGDVSAKVPGIVSCTGFHAFAGVTSSTR